MASKRIEDRGLFNPLGRKLQTILRRLLRDVWQQHPDLQSELLIFGLSRINSSTRIRPPSACHQDLMQGSRRKAGGWTVEVFEKTEEYRLAFRRFACTFLRFPVTTVPPVASMISIAPLAAEPCWQVITPMMLGPNIMGSWNHGSWPDWAKPEGSFTESFNSSQSNSGTYYQGSKMTFSPSRSSSLYGKSSSVQPSSVRLLLCIKS